MSLVPQINSEGISLNEEMTEVHPTLRTINLMADRMDGYIEGKAAVKQAVLKILGTERFKYLIYDWEYGIELVDLIGKEEQYVAADLKRRFEEALLQCQHVLGITDFEIVTISKDAIQVLFTVMTTYGDITVEKGVGIDESKNI